MLAEIYQEAMDKDIRVNVSDELKKFILKKGYDAKYGARPLRRTLQQYVEDKLAEEYLRGNIKAGSLVGLDIDSDENVITSII